VKKRIDLFIGFDLSTGELMGYSIRVPCVKQMPPPDNLVTKSMRAPS
jgi:hypothetical protein